MLPQKQPYTCGQALNRSCCHVATFQQKNAQTNTEFTKKYVDNTKGQ